MRATVAERIEALRRREQLYLERVSSIRGEISTLELLATTGRHKKKKGGEALAGTRKVIGKP